jgi:hypothetical protein
MFLLHFFFLLGCFTNVHRANDISKDIAESDDAQQSTLLTTLLLFLLDRA